MLKYDLFNLINHYWFLGISRTKCHNIFFSQYVTVGGNPEPNQSPEKIGLHLKIMTSYGIKMIKCKAVSNISKKYTETGKSFNSRTPFHCRYKDR